MKHSLKWLFPLTWTHSLPQFSTLHLISKRPLAGSQAPGQAEDAFASAQVAQLRSSLRDASAVVWSPEATFGMFEGPTYILYKCILYWNIIESESTMVVDMDYEIVSLCDL